MNEPCIILAQFFPKLPFQNKPIKLIKFEFTISQLIYKQLSIINFKEVTLKGLSSTINIFLQHSN